MEPGESPRCGTGSTGKALGAAQVGEWAQADPDGLNPVFFVLAMLSTSPPVSQEGRLLPSLLGALA